MPIDVAIGKRFEADIEASFLSLAGGYAKTTDTYDPVVGLYTDTLIQFIKATQPREWARFENTCGADPVRKFAMAFNNACDADRLLAVLRHGFKHRGITFRVCYFKPKSHLNKTTNELHQQNICNCVRQWHYSADNNKSADMVLVLNGTPIVALELKNQYTGQTVDNAKTQWMYDRDPREICFQFSKRILAYYCVDHTEVWMATKLDKGDITLRKAPGINESASGKGNAVPEAKEPLEEVIKKISQLFNGNFTDGDKVLLYALHDKLKGDKKLAKIAKSSDPQVFSESIFPKTFDEVAQDSYVEQTEAFTSLFENKSKYKAVMTVLADMLYKEFNKR